MDESEFICIGKIHRAHGIHGEVVLNPMTDFPERIRKGKIVYLGPSYRKEKISSVRDKPPFLLVSFEGFTDETQAMELRNTFMFVHRNSLPKLPEGEFYFHEIIGLKAEDQAGNFIGCVREILETGANDVYLIEKTDGTEMLLAAIPEVVLSILPAEGRMIVNPPEWL